MANLTALADHTGDYRRAKQNLLLIEKTSGATRNNYIDISKEFIKIYSSAPTSSLADDSLYYTAVVHLKSYKRFKYEDDRMKARKYLKLLAVNYNTWLAPKAYYMLAQDYVEEKDYSSARYYLTRLQKRFPKSEEAEKVDSILSGINKKINKVPDINIDIVGEDTEPDNPKDDPENIKAADPEDSNTIENLVPAVAEDQDQTLFKGDSGKVVVSEIKHFSADDYTRIVIHTTGKATFEKHWLNKNPKYNMPSRLFIDILDSATSAKIPRQIDIKDGLLRSIRWGYNRPGVTRVVLDSQNVKNFTVFRMENPHRIVIDVSSTEHNVVAVKKDDTDKTNIDYSRDANTKTLAGAFGLKINTIVIDPGHGGKDPGAMYGGLKEKDIVLDIGTELYKLFKKNTNLKVYMTRKRDVYIPLEERTAFANKVKADVFISIHVNASKNKNTYGLETFVLDVTNDKSALEVAAKENMATEKSMSDLQGILKDIMLNSKLEESRLLAYDTHKKMKLGLYGSDSKSDRGVKSAPFYVLVGAKMPSILIEAGFISNRADNKKLKTSSYRKKIAESVYKGLSEYIKRFNGN